MRKLFLISLVVVGVFSGCSEKKFNNNVDSISGDVSKVFEGKD